MNNNALEFDKSNHIRCFAHVLNIAVKGSLRQLDEFVLNIRFISVWVNRSPQRNDHFYVILKNKKCEVLTLNKFAQSKKI